MEQFDNNAEINSDFESDIQEDAFLRKEARLNVVSIILMLM